ncbi:MAG: hypothetical protein RLZZ126_1280 [Pseudomonadota bacterium]|jgi:BolA family transcriptional regulator, general stress-responsive regulator
MSPVAFRADNTAAQQIETHLKAVLAPTRLTVRDDSASHAGHAGSNGTAYGTHFHVDIAGPVFIGKSRVACHRLVYDSLRPFIDQGVHAIAIQTAVA